MYMVITYNVGSGFRKYAAIWYNAVRWIGERGTDAMTGELPDAYLQFLAHFHGDRDYFECHELLEEYWKEHPESPFRHAWVGLIQVAVGMYHYRRGNAAGAEKSLAGALRRSEPGALRSLGIDAERWIKTLEEALAAVRAGAPYRDVDMPFADERVEAEGRRRCAELGCAWGAPSRMDEPQLIHRHTLRDRTDVIEARLRSLGSRRGDR